MNTKSTAAQFHRTSLTLGGVLVRSTFIVVALAILSLRAADANQLPPAFHPHQSHSSNRSLTSSQRLIALSRQQWSPRI